MPILCPSLAVIVSFLGEFRRETDVEEDESYDSCPRKDE